MSIQIKMSSTVREALNPPKKYGSPEEDVAEDAKRLLATIEERKRRRLEKHATIIAALASKYPSPINLLSSIEEDLARGQLKTPPSKPCASSKSSSSSFGIVFLFVFLIGGPLLLIFLMSYLNRKAALPLQPKPTILLTRQRSLSL